MKDRASAAPPLQFLDPSERVLMVPFCTTGTGTDAAAAVGGLGGGGGRGGAEEKTRSSRMKTNIFGQMWEGVRGRLRIRRDADKDKGEGEEEDDDDDDDEQRPTRDQVLANYHQLVASGFFSSHAIQSTRHGPPPPRPCTSRGPPSPAPPQWPLAPAAPVPVPAMTPDDDDDGGDKKMTGHPASPRAEVCSPASAASSSRGTKRAAAGPPPGEDEGEGQGEADRDDEGAGEDEATRAHRFLPKRLRRTAPRDRDIISLPRLRGVASRNKGAHDGPAQVPRARRGSTDHDDMATSLGRKIKRPARARTLRTRAAAGGSGSGRGAMEAEPLSVVPDANRGIPRVPAIPAKFTYGEDGRENGGSTR
ncbi:hypothetical protein EsDP_00005518 [Epichloe bromicola]